MREAHRAAPPADGDPATARPTIGEILRQYGPAYRAQYAARMPPEQLQVMDLLERCRTGELAQAVYHCQDCHTYHPVPRSCGNRHCPQCQGHKARQWLQTQLDKLLPCAYFFLTFTLPQERVLSADVRGAKNGHGGGMATGGRWLPRTEARWFAEGSTGCCGTSLREANERRTRARNASGDGERNGPLSADAVE